jgi:CheY-like chemotaxis protein
MAQVLVVDDDPLFREIAREVLEGAGHTVDTAENGVLAMDTRVEPAADLAVVDMLMPERDGIETIADLKGRWPALKVIAVSAGGRNLDADLLLRAAKALGADAIMAKPLVAPAFLALVDQVLSGEVA